MSYEVRKITLLEIMVSYCCVIVIQKVRIHQIERADPNPNEIARTQSCGYRTFLFRCNNKKTRNCLVFFCVKNERKRRSPVVLKKGTQQILFPCGFEKNRRKGVPLWCKNWKENGFTRFCKSEEMVFSLGCKGQKKSCYPSSLKKGIRVFPKRC